MVLASGCHSDRTSGFDAKCRLQHLILSPLHSVYVFGGAAIPADDRTYLPNKEVIDKGLVAFIFLLLITSAYLTEILGLHALFGAFIAGVVMPGNVKFRKIMTEKVEDVSLALFLPLFFVSTDYVRK